MTLEDMETVLSIEAKAHTHPWTRAHFLSSLQSSHECWLVEKDSTSEDISASNKNVVAYAITSSAADEVELLNITVAPDYQQQGIGKQLLKTLCEYYQTRARSFFLEVRESNQAAIALYHNIGFNEVGTRPNYYPCHQQRREDALIMAYTL